ncbi:TrlF family AAA-like ATPase [Bradyrhizobium diazoefficiens]|uniref:TrlF family AAA-like ATPase n=1 Tax=Bradyrhizobium diazoefficiens TaxID=1355477 RepID=UPI00271534F3|nr:AAA family ATPase [Bradyrhizobium diazoefficiens]WLC16296.1 AAA family ATPase [Bradyrhizobium diazoefficiens]
MDNGAHFYRCDFQVHTPRDRNWKGSECVSANDRKQYAASLIAASRAKGLDAIAITDHHDLYFATLVRDAARAELDANGKPIPPGKQIVVFPGIELTLAVPCQALLILDANLPEDQFGLVLNALGIVPSANTESRTVETKRLEHITTLVKLKEDLDKFSYLKNKYVILANVSEGGTDTLLRAGAAGKYAAMPCVGGYLDGAVTQLGKGNRNIVDGKASDYGNKRIALFQTSDNRNEKHTDLGKHTTWVKWATPTAEALRQACLAQESRIAQERPTIPSVSITSLNVTNSVFLGPIQIEFNPQYNALIGGRGTGKSTILEYLRWGLCDQVPSPLVDDELPNYQHRRRVLVEKTLQAVNATVQVGFTVNGIKHVVRRNSKTEELLLKVGAGEFTSCTELDIRTLLPIQAYSQKQLSNVSVRLEELSRFVQSPIRGELDDLEKQFDRASAEIRQEYATMSRLRKLQQQASNDELLLASLVEQTANMRSSLTGLSEEDTKTLDQKPLYDKAEEAIAVWLSDVDIVSTEISNFSMSLDALPSEAEAAPSALPESKVLREIQNSATNFVKKAKDAASKLSAIGLEFKDDDDEYAGKLKESVDAWHAALEAFNERYEAAKLRASAHQSTLSQLAQLEQRIIALRIALANTRKEISGLGKPQERYEAVRKKWLVAKASRAKMITAECAKLTKLSSGEIRATVRIGAGADLVMRRLREAVSGSGVRRDRFDAIGEAVQKAKDPNASWMTILAELEQLATFDPQQGGAKTAPRCPTLAATGLGSSDLVKIAGKLDADTWLELSLSRLEDEPVFEYRVREGDYIPFANASAGQQATALLKALLNQSGPPLIIDQPEEDLDNPVILEVVEQIWNAKKERQIIIASHNANLVVNGDAELVAWCDYRVVGEQSGGKISATGAIDIPAICEAIKRVMEGGENAFKLRKDKYGF